MKWFGRKAAPGGRPALARALHSGVIGAEWPVSYERQVREGYAGNAVAQRAVRLVAEGVAEVPVHSVLDGHAVERIARPMETAATQLLLHGNAYLQIVCDAAGEPVELFPLRPERVTIEVDGRGWPAAYVYRVGEQVTRLPVVDGMGRPTVIHLRAFHPLDDHYGLGCLGAAAGPIAIHNAATRWNKALLDNAARPSGALVYEPGEAGATLTGEQFERLKAEMEASFAGAGNAGRPMLLEGGLKWQSLSLSPADMDFVGLKAAAAREIALAFGVPPLMLGLAGDNTHANYAEANRALWRLTVVPMAARIVNGIAAGLRAWWADAALLLDLDGVPALSEDRERLWAQVTAADFLSVDEKRAMLGFGVGQASDTTRSS